jgi:hypothetical protein
MSCIPTREIDGVGDIIRMDRFASCPDVEVTAQEYGFGDYGAGRWAWILADIVPLVKPVPAVGALSLWEWARAV